MTIEITTKMAIDVDGAPNAYGPKGKPKLDYELNAHEGAKETGKIVGYLTRDDHTPELPGPNDPFPGYYISTAAFYDKGNPNRLGQGAMWMPPKLTMLCWDRPQRKRAWR